MSMGADTSRHVTIVTDVRQSGRTHFVTSLSSSTAIPPESVTAGRRYVDGASTSAATAAAGPVSSPGPGRVERGPGALESPSGRRHYHHQHHHRPSLSVINFPNALSSHRKEQESSAWTLLHQCGLERWKDGHADVSGFPESTMVCDGVIHKDCSFSFCMSRQGIINIHHRGGGTGNSSGNSSSSSSSSSSSGSSIFSFRRRSRFAKIAEHFEYNHIPAQMSSINHFRVKSVVCYRDGLVVLHLSRNANSQFGLLDLGVNKFLGVFGKQHIEFANESLAGEISPDKSRCLIRCPKVGASGIAHVDPAGGTPSSVFCLFDLRSRTAIRETDALCPDAHFCFDPRFAWRRVAVANFEPRRSNAISVVDVSTWTADATNRHAADARRTLYPYLKDLCYSRDGRLLVATLLDPVCSCRERKALRGYRAVVASVYIFDGDTASALHCIEYRRCTCPLHCCPINYKPAMSVCGGRIAVVMDSVGGSGSAAGGSNAGGGSSPAASAAVTSSAASNGSYQHLVQVYKLPTRGLSLQGLCRIAILQRCRLPVQSSLADLPLPTKLINYLQFRPEFD